MSTRRAVLIVQLSLLVDSESRVTAGASSLLVDALRRGQPAAVFSTERDAAAALSSHGMSAALDAATGPVAVGGDAVEVVRALAAEVGADLADAVVLADRIEVLAGLEAAGAHVVAVGLPGVPAQTVADVDLDDHAPLRSHRVELDHGVALLDGWSVEMDRHEPDQVVTVGSNLMTGNGFLGYRGTAPEWDAAANVACVVTDTWDAADGKWSELTSVPNGLRARWSRADGTSMDVPHDRDLDVRWRHHRRLDLLLGRTARRVDLGDGLTVHDERFASLVELGLVAQRHRVTGPVGTRLTLELAVDGEVWDLNGPHLPDLELVADGAADGEVLLARGSTAQSGIDVVVAQSARMRVGRLHAASLDVDGRVAARRWDVEITSPDGVVIDVFMGVAHGNAGPHVVEDDAVAEARRIVGAAYDRGYASLLADQLVAWREVWDAADVEVAGDPMTQACLRFGTYHNVIATPRHDSTLPVGARGLSCQAYQGAAFWDQEVFNLPMYLHTMPEVARGLIGYRVATLDGARRKASQLGFRGAFFAWISGETGDELCPDFFFSDVLSGRPIRNHFNDWQIHVAPDVALTVQHYIEVTGDHGVLADGAGELVAEVARFLEDRVWHDHREDRFHLLELLGPDEWHENVHDNAFTAYQVHEALRFAVELWDADEPGLRATAGRDERDAWQRVADRLFLPEADERGVIEQFRGYHDLEDVAPDALPDRLAHPDEYWGAPNGVAVHTQVLKQADVVQLFVVQPERFDEDVVRANVDHYLPRTAHGSSLSKGAYALVMARLGRTAEARELFLSSATVDLLSRRNAAPGGTFIGGIRTAAAAMSWQAVVIGFGGLGTADGRCSIEPHLPDAWTRLAFRTIHRGVSAHVTVTPDEVRIEVDAEAPAPFAVRLGGVDHDVPPGETLAAPRG